MFKKLVFITSSVFLLIACNSNDANQKTNNELITEAKTQEVDNDFTLIGKQIAIEYPDMQANIEYLSDSTLHWTTVKPQNIVEEGIEQMSYQQVAKDLFFINWIEKDGTTVSQVLDVTKQKVYVYLSFSDEESERGKRSAVFIEGKVKFED